MQFSALEGKIDHAARVLDVAKIVQSHEQEISQAAANAEAEKAKKQKLEEQLTKAFDDVSKFSAEYTALQCVPRSLVPLCCDSKRVILQATGQRTSSHVC